MLHGLENLDNLRRHHAIVLPQTNDLSHIMHDSVLDVNVKVIALLHILMSLITYLKYCLEI